MKKIVSGECQSLEGRGMKLKKMIKEDRFFLKGSQVCYVLIINLAMTF